MNTNEISKPVKKIYSLNLNFSDYISIDINESDRKTTFLVDSQADVCVIKSNAFFNYLIFNENDTIDIKGITNDLISSFGTIYITLQFNGVSVSQIFHVVPDDFAIPSNGILGKDFIKKFKCVLDYGSMKFTMRLSNKSISIPIQSGILDNELTIPPRTEVFRIFKVSCGKFPAIIHSKEIEKGIFSATTVAYEPETVIRILNTNESISSINKNINFETDDLFKYNIYTVNKNGSDRKRTTELLNLLKKNAPENVHSDLLNLCEEFSDIFAMENDSQ